MTPVEGIRAAFPGATIDYAIGAVVQEGIAEFPLSTITNPATGEPGARVAFVRDGAELYVEDRRATALFWFGGDAPTREADRLDITTTYTAPTTGAVRIGIGAAGHSRMWIDGTLVLDEFVGFEGDQLGAAFLNPPARSVPSTSRPASRSRSASSTTSSRTRRSAGCSRTSSAPSRATRTRRS